MGSKQEVSPVSGLREEVIEGGIPEQIVSRLSDDAVAELWHAQGDWMEETLLMVRDLSRVVDGEGEEFSNDELLRLGIGCGIAGPLSEEQICREARQRITELLGQPTPQTQSEREHSALRERGPHSTEVYTVEVAGRADRLYVFEELADRNAFADAVERAGGAAFRGSEMVINGAETLVELIEAEEETTR